MLLLNDVWTNQHPRFRSSKAKDFALANGQRPARFAIKKLGEIVFAISIFSAIMGLLAALDIWIWVPLRWCECAKGNDG
jgi:hypothetical protein